MNSTTVPLLCAAEPIAVYILGAILCLGFVSYLPQYYELLKRKNIDGLSEPSLLILNISTATLAGNSFILNYGKFKCYSFSNEKAGCSFWVCTGDLLPLWQIGMAWIVVIPLYCIYIRFKMRQSDRLCYDISWFLSYMISLLIMTIFAVNYYEFSKDSTLFFEWFAYILGIISAICSAIVWIPQIIQLLRTGESNGLSLLMFCLQTPGNAMIIILQIIYKQNWTSWIGYVILFIEQSIIVIILIVFKCRPRYELIINE